MAYMDGAEVGGGSANTEVFYDWGKIGTAATELNSKLETFKSNVEQLYSSIVALNSSWSGPSYDAFKTNCEDYKKNKIDPLITTMTTWTTKLNELADEAKGTSSTNVSYFQQ